MNTTPDEGAAENDAGRAPVPPDRWRLEVSTREALLGSPSALSDRVMYADIATLGSMYDQLGPEAWRALLEVLKRYEIVEGRKGGRRLGVIGWGVPWVERYAGLGNRPARRAVNSLEECKLMVRDELPGTVGGAGQKVGFLDLSRVAAGAGVELPPVVPTGRRRAGVRRAKKTVKSDSKAASPQVEGTLAETPTRVLADPSTRTLAKTPTRTLAETSTRKPAASPQVNDTLAETPTLLSTAPSRKIDREIEDLLGMGDGSGLLALGLRPALQSDPQDVVDVLVNRLGHGAAASHARRLLDKLDVEATGVSPVRQLIEAILLDVYLVNQDTARDWLAGWGANVKNTTLTHSQLADRLVLAVVATLGLAEYPGRLGGWFGAWSRPRPQSLYANDSLQALREMCEFFQRQRATAERHANPPQTLQADGSAAEAPAEEPVADVASVDVDSLSVADVDQLWEALVKHSPRAAAYSTRRTHPIVRGFLELLLQERPELLAELAGGAATPSTTAPASDEHASPRKSA